MASLPNVLQNIITDYIRPHEDVFVFGSGIENEDGYAPHNIRVYATWRLQPISWWEREDGISITPAFSCRMTIRPANYWLSHISSYSYENLCAVGYYDINGSKYETRMFNLTVGPVVL